MSTKLLNPEHYLRQTICKCFDSSIVFMIGTTKESNGESSRWFKPYFFDDEDNPVRDGDIVEVGKMEMQDLIYLLVCSIGEGDIPRSVSVKDAKGDNINPDNLPDLIVLTAIKE